MSPPHFTILTQREIPLNLSRPAMERIIAQLGSTADWVGPLQAQCEVDNFRNLLLNLLERSEPETGNFDLIGG